MNIRITTDIDPAAILERRGLGSGGEVWSYAGQRFGHYAENYAPFDTGYLSRSYTVTADGTGAQLRYTAPYAHYQYYGLTMGPNVLTAAGWRSMAPVGGKYYTGGSLTCSGGRGSHWDRLTWAAQSGAILADLAAHIGGTVK